MFDPEEYYGALKSAGISFFTGVPDSLLNDLNACVTDLSEDGEDLIAANEGAAVAYAAGRYLASGQIGGVYLQNSGFGNIVNPLTSLIAPEVYSIPMLFFIGWRGQPGLEDEPQHIKQGRVQEALLAASELPYAIHPDNLDESISLIERAMSYMKAESAPFAFLVPKNTFGAYQMKTRIPQAYTMKREEALRLILRELGKEATVVSTTGKTSREVYEIREGNQEGHLQDFLTVGSMGHASQIALGIARARSTAAVCCIDGDGAVLMHMGSLAINGSSGLTNFKHIVINNGAHESVGGQPTVGFQIDLPKIARGCGYHAARSVSTSEELMKSMEWFNATNGPILLEIKVDVGSRSDLGRPALAPVENKMGFMARLGKG